MKHDCITDRRGVFVGDDKNNMKNSIQPFYLAPELPELYKHVSNIV